MSVSKEDGRSSSGPAHETAAPKRTYDMMEGRVGRAIASGSIEGRSPAQCSQSTQKRQGAGDPLPAAKRELVSGRLPEGAGGGSAHLQMGKLRLSLGPETGHRLLGSKPPPPPPCGRLSGWRAPPGRGAVDPDPRHLPRLLEDRVTRLLPAPSQVSWAVPSPLSDTAPTI